MMMDIHFIVGCDGSSCQDADGQTAYPLDDMPDVAFCKVCWTQEMNRRKRTGRGTVLPFPGPDTPMRSQRFHLKYPGFDSESFQKIRRGPKLEE